jgi:hypothetical protein
MGSRVNRGAKMKRLIILGLLLFLILLFIVPVFSKDLQKALYQSNGLTITKTKATYKGKIFYDAVKEQKQLVESEGEADESYMEHSYTPRSVIGPYYSYQYDFYDHGSAGGPPSNNVNVTTINITTNKPASVLELVDEDSLVAALKKDSWVREHVNLAQLNSSRSFNEIIKLRQLSDGFSNEFSSTSYAFFRYDQKTCLVALRLIRQDYMGFDHNQLVELGLWVKPRKGMEKLFQRESHFF